MRLAGTCRQYSKKAIPQLTKITFHKASLRNFKWPYQAIVMKRLEPVSNRIVRIVYCPRKNLASNSLFKMRAFALELLRESEESWPIPIFASPVRRERR